MYMSEIGIINQLQKSIYRYLYFAKYWQQTQYKNRENDTHTHTQLDREIHKLKQAIIKQWH